jgi:hypothetical protein
MHPLKLTRPALAAIFLLMLFLPGCVKRSTHHRTQDELAQAPARAGGARHPDGQRAGSPG